MQKANPKRVGVEGGWLKIWRWMCHFSEEMDRSILVNIIPSKEKNLRKSIDRFSTLHTFLHSEFLFMITVSITHWCSSVLLSLCTLWPDNFTTVKLCVCVIILIIWGFLYFVNIQTFSCDMHFLHYFRLKIKRFLCTFCHLSSLHFYHITYTTYIATSFF